MLRLDDDTADRLVRGLVAPDDAPPGYAELAGLVGGLRDEPVVFDDRTIWAMTATVRSTRGASPSPASARRRRARRRVPMAVVGGMAVALLVAPTVAAHIAVRDLVDRVTGNAVVTSDSPPPATTIVETAPPPVAPPSTVRPAIVVVRHEPVQPLPYTAPLIDLPTVSSGATTEGAGESTEVGPVADQAPAETTDAVDAVEDDPCAHGSSINASERASSCRDGKGRSPRR